ncbi:MAG: hypothetical protein OEQ18_16755, partial [Gammaproteobacteria bacterium]|nr:hypothetical protein [Gammaproteobacteria bacterium]
AGAAAATFGDDDTPTDFDDSAVPVDPGLQPFPAPEEDVALDRELEKLANETEAPDPATVLDHDSSEPSTGEVEFDSLDFDLDLEEEEAATDDAAPALAAEKELDSEDDDNLLDISDLEDLKDSPTAALNDDASAPEPEDDDNLLDLNDLDIELEPTSERDDTPPPRAAESIPGMDFELAEVDSAQNETSQDEEDADADEDWDEAATKLDLAKAYIDMGDKAGARSIIDEVMREGNQQQRDQAAQLASQLGS